MSSIWCLLIDHKKKCLCEVAVPISPQTTIHELKQLIKGMKPMILGNVDIDMLEVWKWTALKVSDGENIEELEERLRMFEFSNNQTTRMSRSGAKVWSLDVQEDERLLVRLPSPLWCLVVDPDQRPVGSIISVTVSPGTNVFSLKEMVLATTRIEIGVNELAVWRCLGLKVRGDNEDGKSFEARLRTFNLSNNQHAKMLLETSNVLELKVPPDEILLVQLPDIWQGKRKRDEEDSLPPEIKRFKIATATTMAWIQPPASESKKIARSEYDIVFNRSFEPSENPLVLLHEAFTIFKDRCRKAPSERAFACLDALAPVGARWHALHASYRRTAIQSMLERHMDLRFHEENIPGTDLTTDGNLAVVVMPAAIQECKNEHVDILSNATQYYANFLSNALDHPYRFYNFDTCFPSILMIHMGPYMGFYGAAWDGNRARVEPLTPLFDMSTHRKEVNAIYAMAATFDALVVAIDSIQAHYNSIEANARANPIPPKRYNPHIQKARGYPFLTSYRDNLNGQDINFVYNERLSVESLFFCAAIVNQPDSNEFFVKFTSQYSEDAHNFLASRDLAPRLRACIRVSADWIAVIMDSSNHQGLYDLILSDADKEKVRRKVTCVVQMLHQEGFVHGDIRDTNILLDVKSLASDDVKIHLIDFDWAGPVGEAKYPVGINKETVRRPDSVEGGGPITKQHDIDMATFFLFARRFFTSVSLKDSNVVYPLIIIA